MCIAAANAKFRVRTIATERYVEYMKFFEQRRNQPVQMLLSAEDIPAIAAVMRVAETNSNNPCITLAGAERRITVSHANRIQKQLAAEYPVGAGFSVDLKAKYLRAAIAAAGHFGSAITLRFSPDDSNGVYIGAQAFHSVVMAMRPEKEEVDEADPATAEEHCL
jgi:hypothetical protein